MKSFILVQVDYEYCNYLRRFDSKVCYNFGFKRIRPFIGILFEVNNILYFAPLSSPKEKHLKMRNTIDFMKIDNGKLGAINFNNMVPVIKDCYDKIDLNECNKKYANMLNRQLFWLNRNYDRIKNKARTLYNKYVDDTLDLKIRNRCCNFKLLEEKCLEYHTKIKV